jgi:D-alanine-D-alanine ligase
MRIALLTGGISAERPISLRSSEWITSFIAQTEHICDVYDIPTQLDDFLGKYSEYDIVLPYIHGQYGEDGVLTGLCETLGLKYIWSPATTHALCIDKFRTNCVIEKIEKRINIPRSWLVDVTSPDDVGITQGVEQLPYPLIVKPNMGGSSAFTKKVSTYTELMAAIDAIKNASTKGITIGSKQFNTAPDTALVQECIEGEEYTVGIVGTPDSAQALPIMQIVNVKAAFFDWQEKYESDGSNEIFPDDMSSELRERLTLVSQTIYSSLNCRGLARIDYRVRGNEIFFLEVNTFPGATKASFIPKMWQKTGKSMGDFIEMLVKTAS